MNSHSNNNNNNLIISVIEEYNNTFQWPHEALPSAPTREYNVYFTRVIGERMISTMGDRFFLNDNYNNNSNNNNNNNKRQ